MIMLPLSNFVPFQDSDLLQFDQRYVKFLKFSASLQGDMYLSLWCVDLYSSFIHLFRYEFGTVLLCFGNVFFSIDADGLGSSISLCRWCRWCVAMSEGRPCTLLVRLESKRDVNVVCWINKRTVGSPMTVDRIA